jgi:hypothetical protein
MTAVDLHHAIKWGPCSDGCEPRIVYVCDHCLDLSGDHRVCAWPCPTVKAGWRAPDAEQFVIGHQVGKTWYRSLTPDGKVWCESSDREDFIDDEGLDTGPDGVPLTFQKLTHYSATSGWQEWAP